MSAPSVGFFFIVGVWSASYLFLGFFTRSVIGSGATKICLILDIVESSFDLRLPVLNEFT